TLDVDSTQDPLPKRESDCPRRRSAGSTSAVEVRRARDLAGGRMPGRAWLASYLMILNLNLNIRASWTSFRKSLARRNFEIFGSDTRGALADRQASVRNRPIAREDLGRRAGHFDLAAACPVQLEVTPRQVRHDLAIGHTGQDSRDGRG